MSYKLGHQGFLSLTFLQNKRGVSGVVTTVMLILLGMAAVSIAGVYIMQVVKSPALSPELSCFDMQVNQDFQVNGACYNVSDGELMVIVQRSFEDLGISSFDFVFGGDGDSTSWRCGGTCGFCKVLDSGEMRKYYFDFSDLDKPKEVEIRIDSCGLAKTKVTTC